MDRKADFAKFPRRTGFSVNLTCLAVTCFFVFFAHYSSFVKFGTIYCCLLLLFLTGTALGQRFPGPASKNGQPFVVFQPHPDQRYGFDELRHEAWKGEYTGWTNAQADNYFIPHKSVAKGESDVVNAAVHSASFFADSLTFFIVEKKQPVLFTVRNTHLVTLQLPPSDEAYTVVARFNETELGRMKVVVYEPQVEKVIIVPLVRMPFQRDSLLQAVNKIYRQANVQLQIDVKPLFKNKKIDTLQLFDNPSPAYDRYTEQMHELRDLYFSLNPDADREAYYVFVVPGFTNPAIKAYMVRNKAIAFVSVKNTRFKDVAAVLARGIGLLKDSWVDGGPAKGTTGNLMDEGRGTHLRHFQWESLRHSSHSYSFYDNYEDVKTNNGIVAYYFWKENPDGTIKLDNGNLLLSIRRPFKKNYVSYHLNIDHFFFKTIFTVKGRMVNLCHILAVLLVCFGIVFYGRKLRRWLRERVRWKKITGFGMRFLQLIFALGLSYGGFVLVDQGYGWYEVRSGLLSELGRQSPDGAMEMIAENENRKYPAESQLCSELLIRRKDNWYLDKQRNVLYFQIKRDAKGNWTKARLANSSDSLIVSTKSVRVKAESHYIVVDYRENDGTIYKQQVYNHLGIDITNKLHLNDPARRILVFVNGYRPTSIGHTFEENFNDIRKYGLEFPDSKNLVYSFDRYDYWRPWQAMDLQFIKRINPVETFYADGHFSVTTSNHRSLFNFTTISSIYPKRCPNWKKHTCYLHRSVKAGILSGGKTKTIKLHHTRPNKSGFWKRRMNGRIAGRNIYQMLNELPNSSENDTLYIVAHSMGYAYALGIIDELRGKIRFGDIYILAPENAASGSVHLNEWEQVWQYGSNFDGKKHDAPCLLDGVAPQFKAGGISEDNRIYIPRQFYTRKGFFDSHFIGYYTWIFDIPKGSAGYIPQR